MLHRVSDGTYIPVQAKGRSSLADGEVRINVKARSITDDLVVMIGGEIVDGGIGPTVLVVPTPDFRRLALFTTDGGVPEYWMAFGMRPRSNSRWLPWLVPSHRLVEKFGVPMGLPALAVTKEQPRLRGSALGFLGEAEVIRRLAEAEHLNLFRPFPDLEIVELAVRHLTNGHVVGLQIKTVSVDAAHFRQQVMVWISTFRPAPTTYLAVLAWMSEERRFHKECLVIPSEELLRFARTDGPYYVFEFHPGSTKQTQLDKYRHALSDLCAEVDSLL